MHFLALFAIQIFGLMLSPTKHNSLKDPIYETVTERVLMQRIESTSLASEQNRILISIANYSHLSDVAYRKYKQIYEKSNSNFYANRWYAKICLAYYDVLVRRNDATANKNRADMQIATKLWSNAQNCYLTAQRINPKSGIILAEYGYMLRMVGSQRDTAVKYCRQGVKLEPKNGRVHCLLAEVLAYPSVQHPDFAEAADEFRKAIMLSEPSFSRPHRQFAEMLIRAGKFPEAQEELNHYLDLAPKEMEKDSFVTSSQRLINIGLGKNRE